MEKRIPAASASQGIAIGRVRLLATDNAEVDQGRISEADIGRETARYHACVARCAAELRRLVAECPDAERAGILQAHTAILEDPYLEQLTLSHIEKRENVQRALMLATAEITSQFLLLEDETLRERVADFREESMRMLRCLRGHGPGDAPLLEAPAVILARDLPPGFAAQMDRQKVLGFATEFGGATSHTAIMARNLDIPAVVGAGGLLAAARDGMTAIVDGLSGRVILDPDPATLEEAEVALKEFRRHRAELDALRRLPAETPDGHRMGLLANIGFEKECASAREKGAEGIGLYRTEFLYMESEDFPTEDQQMAAYRYVARQMDPKPVVIRTLDIGGDKALRYHPFPQEANPMLGCRAIRFSLRNPHLLKIQLRAILRASAYGVVRILYPMVVSVEELLACKIILSECKDELREEDIPFDADIRVGMMVETPAAVLMADHFAQHVDFFSIGTNDLTQYVLTADRGNEAVQNIYSGLHPAVLEGIRRTVAAARSAGRQVCVCGEMAADPKTAVLLMGMGVDEVSISAAALPDVKKVLRRVRHADALALAGQVAELQTTREVEKALDRFMAALAAKE